MNIPRIVLWLSILFICAMLVASVLTMAGCGQRLTENQRQWTAPGLDQRLGRAVFSQPEFRQSEPTEKK